MDLGYFRRSKIGFWLWIIGPGLVGGSVFSATSYFSRAEGETLQHRIAFSETVTEMDRELSQAGTLLEDFATHREGGVSAGEELNASLNDIARGCGFQLNSLTIEPDKSRARTKNLSVLQVTVVGEASFAEIMRFFYEIQRTHPLLTITSAKLSAARSQLGALYAGNFVLHHREVAP